MSRLVDVSGKSTEALRPAAGSAGRLWSVTDGANPGLYYDDGSTWILVAAATGPAGPPGVGVWEGTWSDAVEYVAGDLVERNGSTYVSLTTNTNQDPATQADDWDLVASAGAAGAAGETGAAGPSGTSYEYVPSTLVNEARASQGASFSADTNTGTANLAFDENDSTYWATVIATGGADPAAGAWIKADLGSAKEITHFRVLQGPSYQATSFKLQSSTDNTNWTDRRVFAALSDSGVEKLPAPITARYWRLLGVDGEWENFYWTISTIDLYTGDPGTGGIDTSIVTMNMVIDGGGAVIASGVKGDLVCDFEGTIEAVTLLADASGSIVVDIWKDTYANFPPVDADSITASAPPTLSSSAKSRDATLTGWTTAISAGDILRFNVDSATTVTRVTVALKIRRT